MHPFELTLPDSLAEALKTAGDDSMFKAAGIDVLDRLKERVDRPDRLVDLWRLKQTLGDIQKTDAGVSIGALVTLQRVADAAELGGDGATALRESCGEAATPQVRRRATLGGNLLQKARCWYLRSAAFGCLHGGDGPLCQARIGENRYHAILGALDCVRVHPSNAAPPLIAMGAEVEAQGTDGSRRFPILELFPKEPAAAVAEHTLKRGEILTAVHVPTAALQGRSAYREAREKQSFDWPTASAAVWLRIDGGRIQDARVCLGAVAPIPWASAAAAKELRGKAPSAALFAQAAEAAFADAVPLTENAYKIQVGRAVLVDALTAAAGGK